MKNEEYEKLLSPTPFELVLFICEGIGNFMWRIAQFSPTNTIATALGHGFDPDGSILPEWEFKPDRVPIETDEVEIRSGGFPVGYGKDGLVYAEPITKAQAVAEKKVQTQTEITAAEWDEMRNYNPPLLNIPLARKIKRYWQEGRTDHEAAVLSECSVSYAKHYRLAFEKAAKKTT